MWRQRSRGSLSGFFRHGRSKNAECGALRAPQLSVGSGARWLSLTSNIVTLYLESSGSLEEDAKRAGLVRDSTEEKMDQRALRGIPTPTRDFEKGLADLREYGYAIHLDYNLTPEETKPDV